MAEIRPQSGANESATDPSPSPHPGEKQVETQREQRPQAPTEDVPPNGGYGWVCTVCVFLLNAHTWGLNSSYGVFLAHYLANNKFPGATSLDFAFIGGLSVASSMLISPISTIVSRQFGTRITILIGTALETLALIGASFTEEIWQLFLSQGVCFGWGMGFIFVSSVGVIPQWFTTKRSFANGIGAAGSGFGGLIYSLAANAIIQNISLGWAFRVIGIIACVVNTTCALLLKDRNKQVGSKQLAFDFRLFLKPEFNLMQLWAFFSMLGYVVLLFSLPNYADSIGLTAHQGSVINALLQLGQMIGRPPVGYFSDTFGRLNMASTMTFLAGLFSLVIWTNAKAYGVLIFFAIIGGTVAGTFWCTVAPVSAEVSGLQNIPSALSITWVIGVAAPTLFSEPIALEIAENSSARYLGTQLFAGFMYLAAAASLWLVRTWKVGQIEQANLEKEDSSETSGNDQDHKVSPFMKRLVAWKKV